MLGMRTDRPGSVGFGAEALDFVAKATTVDPRPKGLLHGDGRIMATAQHLLEALGFAPTDDLRGLPFSSLWPHQDRRLVDAALRLAQTGEDAKVHLDFGYIHDRNGRCTFSLTPAGANGLVLMTLVASTLATGSTGLG